MGIAESYWHNERKEIAHGLSFFPLMGEGQDVKQTSSQFHRQRDTASTVTTLRCPSKGLPLSGLMLRRFVPTHNNASKAEKRNRLNPWPRSWNPRNLPIKNHQTCSSRKIRRVFFAYFYFAIKKKYVGWRAETRRFLLLISELFWSAREIPIPQNQNQDRGVTAPLAAFLFAPGQQKGRKKWPFDCSRVSFIQGAVSLRIGRC